MSNQFNDDPFADPSVEEGEELVYCKETVFKFKKEGSDEIVHRPIIMKMITKIGNDGELAHVKFEMSTQSDVFFLYEVKYDKSAFLKLREKESLRIEFDQFPEIMAEIFDKTGKDNSEFFVLFEVGDNNLYFLKIFMPMRFKDVDIFTLEFHKSSDELIHDQVQYRYTMVQYELRKTRIEITNFLDTIRSENMKNKNRSLRN